MRESLYRSVSSVCEVLACQNITANTKSNGMISPLRTWQHQDPKGLWPALGGLALLVHVGVIGASVPYLLSWQVASEQRSQAAIPVELVAGAPIESASSIPIESESESALEAERLQSQRSLDNGPTAQSLSEAAAEGPEPQERSNVRAQRNLEANASALAPNNSRSRSNTGDREESASDLAGQSGSKPSAAADENTSPSEPVPAEESQSAGESEGTLAGEEDSASADDSQSPATAEQSTNGSQSGEPPALETSDSLPAPTTGGETAQSLQIRIVGTPQYDPISDFESAPPELVGTGYAEITLKDAGCGAIAAQATGVPLVYRIGVREDGTIYSASLQGDQSGAIAPADDEAVACLIVNSGITFARSSDSASKIDDSLLITFELSDL